jgi:hypothetical protein
MTRRAARAVLAGIAATGVAPGIARAVCQEAEIIAPERGALVAEARPAVEWRGLPGVARYRVQLESRVPEGRVVASTDSVVEDLRFVPPANLAESRAAVKLLVTAACDSGIPPVSTVPARFFIDLASACPAVSKLSFEGSVAGLGPAGGRMAWTPAAAATDYEVVVYAMPGGKVLANADTPSAFYNLPPRTHEMMVAVRPRCGGAVGPASYGFVPAP